MLAEKVTKKLVALRVHVVRSMRTARDAGQGSLEYIGAILVAAAVVGVVVAGTKTLNVDEAFKSAVQSITGGNPTAPAPAKPAG